MQQVVNIFYVIQFIALIISVIFLFRINKYDIKKGFSAIDYLVLKYALSVRAVTSLLMINHYSSQYGKMIELWHVLSILVVILWVFFYWNKIHNEIKGGIDVKRKQIKK